MKRKRVIADLIFEIYKIVYEAVFPSKCLVCGNFMQIQRRARCSFKGKYDIDKHSLQLAVQNQIEKLMAEYLCRDCIQGLSAVEPPLCTSCGLPFHSRIGENHHCSDCLTSPKKFGIARAALVYDKISTEVIHCFKYKGKTQLAKPLSVLLMTTFRYFWDENSIDLILP